jgi:N-acyl homoserine lactone hydrolase
VQRAELDRAERESPELCEWFDFMNARFELLDGDAEILPGLSVLSTPGHTSGHQCVTVSRPDGADLLIGDAAYTPALYTNPALESKVRGQAADPRAWRDSLERVRLLSPERIHFCHHTDVIHS